MASGKLHTAASRSGDLPLDALRDILLRLSAKELCRLRAVSPTWRSLTYDRAFIAAHMARQREPLLAFARRGEDHTHSVDIVDLSGKLVRRMPRSEDGIGMLGTRLELVCVTSKYRHMALWVLNPTTGAVLALPWCHSEYMGNGPDKRFSLGYGYVERYAFGRVSTKVLGFNFGKISVPTEMGEFRSISVGFRIDSMEYSNFRAQNLFRKEPKWANFGGIRSFRTESQNPTLHHGGVQGTPHHPRLP
ncbi:unnamed protein product [Urochloa humidicola]